ncbi:uncharacterized protein NPIL_67671 [Nephila pilipes]|uniref:Centromere protein F n=1 Tax=Nephila pilipes TaxID=299642 RepID=A0A8X6UT20_NEPPI|nr:uncharacterized protein NPIL_67671 [Nephila pilipes]
MDWASSEWKQDLTPLAVQKVNALEEKIEKLQKERQQKQLQFECLELALEKEKRKVEKEKQQTTLIQRELQSLADVCKDFENKHQKLQNEIQNRDLRIGSLEGLLSQAKKDNCRLQQLENDLEELRSVRETSRIAKEQKELSFTIDQKSINILSEKENNQNFMNDNDQFHSLKEKISSQESLIEELRTKLSLLSSNESNKVTINSQSKTPGKPKIEIVEASPAFRPKSTLNIWDSFASTPAKENKETVLRHHSDSTALASTDGKVLTLQTQLKQLRQELDCQRHNFEASKNSLEQKFKEKENVLKADLKYQTQVNANLDKDLKDTRNKYQQEITQASKKLDMLTAQLKKAEVTNVTLEKDIKHMETKINSNNLTLKAKEEEIQDLQKQKHITEASLLSLQTQVFELDKKCNVLEEQNSLLTDNINTFKLQLDGSYNLVQEKENSLAKAEKQLETTLISNKDLQSKIQESENILLTEQKRNAKLIQNETTLKEKIEVLEKERNHLYDKFTTETKKSQEFECTIEKQRLNIFSLEKDLDEKATNLIETAKQMTDTQNKFDEKVIELNNSLKCTQEKCLAFENNLKECSLRESTIMEKLKHVEKEKEELFDKFDAESHKTQELEMNMVEAKQSILLLKEEVLKKSLISEELNNKLEASKNSYELELKQLQGRLSAALENYTTLDNKYKESSSSEISLTQKLEQLNKEKAEVISQLTTENNLRSSLDSKVVELESCCEFLKLELSNKSLECDDLKAKNIELEAQSMNEVTKVQGFEDKLTAALAELASLQIQLQIISENESQLKEQVHCLENEKKELDLRLMEEINKAQNLSTSHKELKSNISSLEEKLTNKSSELEKINQIMETSTEEFKIKIHQLEVRLSTILEENATLENELRECSLNETSLKQKLEEVNKAKEEIISEERHLKTNLEFQIIDLRRSNEYLKEELCELNKEVSSTKNLKTEYEAKVQQLETELSTAKTKFAEAEKESNRCYHNEMSAREKAEHISKEAEETLCELKAEKNTRLSLESKVAELSDYSESLNEQLSKKCMEFEELTKRTADLEEKNKVEVQLLEEKLTNEQNQFDLLQQQLKVSSTNERILLEEMNTLKEGKNMLDEKLIISNEKIQNFESNSVVLKQNIQVLNEKLCQVSSELDKAQNQIMLSKKECEATILELKEKLSDVQIECTCLKNELKISEENNTDLNERIILEINKIQGLQSNIDEMKTLIYVQQTELSLKSSQLDEYEEKKGFISDESKCAELENELQEFIMKEALLKEKILMLEKEIEDLSNGLKAAGDETQKLRSVIDEQKGIVISLKEELAAKCSEVEQLSILIENSKHDYEINIQDIERKLQETLAENKTIKNLLQNCKDDEISLVNKIDLLINEKEDIAACLETEICKKQNLELNIEGWKMFVVSLEQDLSCMTLECENIDDEYLVLKNHFEGNIQKLQSKLSAKEVQLSALELQLKNCLIYEEELKEKLKMVEEQEKERTGLLTVERQKIIVLEESHEKFEKRITLLEEELSFKIMEVERLEEINKNRIDYENKIRDLESKLFTCQTEKTCQFEEWSAKEVALKDKLQLLEKEYNEIILRTSAEIHKTKEFEMQVKQLLERNVILEKELNCKVLQLDEMMREKMNYQLKAQKLEEDLLTSNKEYSSIMNKLQKSSAKQSFLKEEVGALTKVKQELEFKIEELNMQVSLLEEALSLKEFEQNELIHQNMAFKEDFEIKVQNLENQLSITEKELSDLHVQLAERNVVVKHSEEMLQILKKEKFELNENFNSAKDQILKLELDFKESKKVNKCFEEELSVKSLKEDELVKQIETMKKDYLLQSDTYNNGLINQTKYVSATEICRTTASQFKSFPSSQESDSSKLLHEFFVKTLDKICCLEHGLRNKIEKCKFLCSNQLVNLIQLDKIWKIFLLLRKKLIRIQLLKKFIFCFCDILKSDLTTHMLNIANEIVLIKIFPSEFCLSLQNFHYLCINTFNKILFSISQTFEKGLLMDDCFIFFKNHSNIHSCDLHLPVIQKTAYLLYLTKFNKIQIRSKPEYFPEKKLNMFSLGELNTTKLVDLLRIQEIPFFLNFAFTLSEWVSKMCYNELNASEDNTLSTQFCYSTFQLKNALSSLVSSSPVFHVFRKYYKEILSLKTGFLDEICYWKYHSNILGINKNDILKILNQLEEKSKRDDKLNRDIHLKKKPFKEENHNIQTMKESLENSLKIEKEKQKLLNATIEEIEKDLGETFIQKEKFKNMVLHTNKLLSCLKKFNDEIFAFSNIRLVGGNNYDICFCEKCIIEEEMVNDSSHDILTLQFCFEWINKLVNAGCQLERKLNELRQHEFDSKTLYKELQDKNSELEMTVNHYSKDLKNVNSEIENMRNELKRQVEKNEMFSKSIDRKDTLELELCNKVEEYENKINILEQKIILLSSDQEKMESELVCKEKEISSLKSLIDEKIHQFEKIHFKCEEYENKIYLLNSTISKFQEEKKLNEHLSILNQSHNLGFSRESDCINGKSSKGVISDLQIQVDSLKNVSLEKQNDEKLQELSEQNACLKTEISIFTQKYNDEKKTTKNLLLKLNDSESLKNDAESIANHLKCKNESLEKDINVLKFVNREHEQEIFKKNSDLEKNRQIIEQLRSKIGEIEKEQSSFKIQTKESEKKEWLKFQLKEMTAMKSNLEEEIARFKLVETEKNETLKKVTEIEFQRNCVTQQFDKLKSELEKAEKNNTELTIKNKELCDLLNNMNAIKASLEEDLNKKKNCIACLNAQLEYSSTENINIKKRNSELSSEISALKKVEKFFQQETESLAKQLKDAMKNIKLESNTKQQLKVELDDMKERLVKSQKLVNVHFEPEFQKTKNSLNNAFNFISNILKIILDVVENYTDYRNFEELKSIITSFMIHWKKNPEEQFQLDLFDHLQLFFKTLIDKHKDDSETSMHVISIMESVNKVGSFCESNHYLNSTIENISNVSVFEETFLKSSMERNSYSPKSIITDLMYIKKEIDKYFSSLKSIISERTEKIIRLKSKLHEFSLKANDCNSKSSDTDKTSFKWKYELLKRQNRQLEEKYNKVALSAEQMEKSIKLLQEEKQNLEEEADELCNEMKKLEAKYASSDELIHALEELSLLKQKMRDIENENNWLKSNLREIQLCQKIISKRGRSDGKWSDHLSSQRSI